MLDQVTPSSGSELLSPDPLASAIAQTRDSVRIWWQRSDGENSWLLTVPDVGPACEVLLADNLFHDLNEDELQGLVSWIRSQQSEDGTWSQADGIPDLSLTTMAWWALAQSGASLDSEPMDKARRAVLEMGGAQRSNFVVRLWLAMAGLIPWAWLPAVPSELWLVPPSVPFSISRLSTWARGMITPYHVLASTPAHLQLCDASSLLLRSRSGELITPRLTKAGVAGDLLQVFDRSTKLLRRLPRGPIHRAGQKQAISWIRSSQQKHGGWFSVRPTLMCLLALRASGATSDDIQVMRGLAYLRKSRGYVEVAEGRVLAQALSTRPLALAARLAYAAGRSETNWLVCSELASQGPWQQRADTRAGGWPLEIGGDQHLDLVSTCFALDILENSPDQGSEAAAAWSCRRRAGEVIMAMQERDGSFARFERGESQVMLAKLPWLDANQLALVEHEHEYRVTLTAMALRVIAGLGWSIEDDRIARGIAWIDRQFRLHERSWSVTTLAEVSRCLARQCSPEHPTRKSAEQRLRARQREDGSFGQIVDTARALYAMLDLHTSVNKPGAIDQQGGCVQCFRAANHLARSIRLISVLEPSQVIMPGLGLSPWLNDPSANVREAHLALLRYRECGGQLGARARAQTKN